MNPKIKETIEDEERISTVIEICSETKAILERASERAIKIKADIKRKTEKER
jgi:hypothetical protein